MAANVLAYGFQSIEDLVDDRLIGDVGVETVATAVRDSLAIHNQVIAAAKSLFVTETTAFQRRYLGPTRASLQNVDPGYGRARPIMVKGHYDVAWPLYSGMTALADSRIEFLNMTMEEANRRMVAILEADARWMRDRMLGALFTNTDVTFVDEEHGSLTCKPLANGDATTYFFNGAGDTLATDTHFLSQANALSNGADNMFLKLAEKIREHPAGTNAEVIQFIPSGLVSAAQALTNFYDAPDTNIRLGDDSARLASAGPSVAYPGMLLGYDGESKSWIVRWDVLPVSRIIAVRVGGDRPLCERIHPLAALRGFAEFYERENAPFNEIQFLRYAGFAANDRLAAAVGQVSDANATYDIPTGYTTPMM